MPTVKDSYRSEFLHYCKSALQIAYSKLEELEKISPQSDSLPYFHDQEEHGGTGEISDDDSYTISEMSTLSPSDLEDTEDEESGKENSTENNPATKYSTDNHNSITLLPDGAEPYAQSTFQQPASHHPSTIQQECDNPTQEASNSCNKTNSTSQKNKKRKRSAKDKKIMRKSTRKVKRKVTKR